jgi:hypothetical protein
MFRKYFFRTRLKRLRQLSRKSSRKDLTQKETRKTERLLNGMALFCRYSAQTRPQICPESHTFDSLLFFEPCVEFLANWHRSHPPFSTCNSIFIPLYSALYIHNRYFRNHPPPSALILEDICCKQETRDAPTLGPPTYFFFLSTSKALFYRGAAVAAGGPKNANSLQDVYC